MALACSFQPIKQVKLVMNVRRCVKMVKRIWSLLLMLMLFESVCGD